MRNLANYTMNYQEAAELANHIKAKVVIPTHYGSIVGSKEDAIKFKELVKNKEVKILIKLEAEIWLMKQKKNYMK